MKNNKLLFALMLLFLGSQITFAQSYDPPVFAKGDLTLNAGIGILPTFRSPNITSKTPPVSLNVEYRIAKRATIGAFGAYASSSFDAKLPEHAVIPRSSESKQYMFGVRAAAHYDVNKTDFYGGLMLGYNRTESVNNISQSREDEVPVYPVSVKNEVIYTAFVGVQQRLTKNLGVYGEVGYGISILNFGVSWKL